jgi:small neutral amino acid transporter SnatA (MarC family)
MKFTTALRRLVPERTTVVAVVGVGSLIFGIWQIHRPSALIAGGLIAIAFAVLETAAQKREELIKRVNNR